jgi:hypothetical protein
LNGKVYWDSYFSKLDQDKRRKKKEKIENRQNCMVVLHLYLRADRASSLNTFIECCTARSDDDNDYDYDDNNT